MHWYLLVSTAVSTRNDCESCKWPLYAQKSRNVLQYVCLMRNQPAVHATFSSRVQDNETLLAYLLQRGEESRALAVLRHPNISHELIYKFAPVCTLYIKLVVMTHETLCRACSMQMALKLKRLSHCSFSLKQALLAAVPGDTIDAWIACKPPLDARRLLPALMNACEASPASQLQNYALRFVEHCISQLQSTDTTLHNLAVCHALIYCALCIVRALSLYLQLCRRACSMPRHSSLTVVSLTQVSLYSQDADEQRLLQYLRSARGSLGSPLYEPQFALQVARQHSKLNACVLLLCELNLHEVRSRHSHTLLALLLCTAS